TGAANWLLECLSVLQDTRDTPGLLAAFQAFSEAVLLLSCLAAKRLQELGHCPGWESLAQTLQLLHKCVPLIHRAKHGALTHSSNCQADLFQDSIFQLTERTIRELLSLLTEPQDRSGIFSQEMSRLLALLSHPDPLRLSKGRFSSHLEAVILHGMLLAESSRLDLQLELVERCWVLLQLRRSICSHMCQREGQPGQSQGLEQECHSMREELENLDRAVLRATLCQILDGFFEEKEPMRQLVEGALSLAGSGCFPAGPGGILRQLQPLIAAFFAQAQQMLRAADLVLARCTKAQTAREIREGVEHLQSLLASLPSLLTETSGNTTGQLQALCCAWARATSSLLHCFEETIGMREFLEFSILELAKHKEWCEAALRHQDPEGFSWHAARLKGWARWVVGATTRHVDRATDPIFRNGLLVWVEQLANSILELGAVTALLPGRFSCLQSRAAFSQAASCLMESAVRVQAGLDGSNHLDILSPLREQVRSTKVGKGLALSPSHTGIHSSMDEAAFQGDIQSHPSSPPANIHLGPWKGNTDPVTTALLEASRAGDMDTVRAAYSILLELSNGCVEAAQEALPVAEHPQLQVLQQHQDIAALTREIISLATEMAPGQLRAPGRLLQMALRLSGRIRDTQECLAAVAGSWNGLAQQVLGFILSGDFPRGKQALDETMMGLAGAVQLAGDIASTACRKENPSPSDVPESFLQLQAKFSRAQLNTKVFLEKAASFGESCGMEKAVLELHSVQWAVGMRILLDAMDRFIGRDVLFLRELSSATRNKVGPQSLLAAVAENSLRLQEAARLSYLSCPGDRGAREILVLREEIKVLMEALLDVSNTLLLSPLPTASLAIRFELLQRDVALRAKALLLHLERVNMEQLQLIQDVLGAALFTLSQEERERSKEAFEEKANRLMANVQWVRNTLRDAPEAGAQLPSQPNLLSVADHLLLLTADVVGSARRHCQSHRDTRNPRQGTGDPHLDTGDPRQDTGDPHQDTGDPRLDTGDPHLDTGDPRLDTGDPRLDSMVWYWSAKAHYLMTQLRVIHGIDRDILRRLTECLQRERLPGSPNGTARLSPAPAPTDVAGTDARRSRGVSGTVREVAELVQ
ncbi:CTNA1 protein, partial [Origma solitaria]|nr:CTNA1 protein [Origma solitaria]